MYLVSKRRMEYGFCFKTLGIILLYYIWEFRKKFNHLELVKIFKFCELKIIGLAYGNYIKFYFSLSFEVSF